MNKLIELVVIYFALASNTFAGGIDSKVVDHLSAVSVTIETSNGSGSGIVKTRIRGTETLNFVFTAGHVISSLKKTRTVVDPKSGSPRIIVEFDDAKIVKVLVENGRTVGKLEIFASVVRFNEEQDLALLRVRQKNFLKDGVEFYLDPKPLSLGTPLVHIGSLLGEMGSGSLTTGIVSQNGRLIGGQIFDQVTCTAFPGSSGGGVFLEDGRLVGQVLRGAGESFVLTAPSRRIVKWAKEARIGWAVDNSVAMPSDEELAKIPVEDIGTIHGGGEKAAVKPSVKTFIYHKPVVLFP